MNPTSETVNARDIEILTTQLERVPRGVVAVAARCLCGAPLVVQTAPLLPDGSPFPTMYYLTHPAIVKAVSTLEAGGQMEAMNRTLQTDSEMAARYQRAHLHYLERRAALAEVAQIEGISAGGMPTRVKCLHALVGHSLAAGRGVNPFGDLALELIVDAGMWDEKRCYCQPGAQGPDGAAGAVKESDVE